MQRFLKCALMCSGLLFSTSSSASEQYQTWLGGFVNGPLGGRFFLQSDIHYRAYDNFTPNFILVRPGIAYKVADGMFATIGYGWTPSFRAKNFSLFTDEHRLWQQWSYEFPLAQEALKITVRSRLEERVRPQFGFEVGFRFRQMLRATAPLFPTAKTVTLVLWDEIFLALNDTNWGGTGQHAGFDQNRFFGGVGWQAVAPDVGKPGIRFELGYMNQYVQRVGNANGDLSNHTLALNSYVGWK
jgi:Protein of unknown function (DUF2490)